MNIVEGQNDLIIVMEEILVVPQGRIGKWDYSVTCAYPTVHREEGDWPDHLLEFDYDLYPSTWFIGFQVHNESDNIVMSDVVITDSNANIVHPPSPRFGDGSISPGGTAWYSLCMTLPRAPGAYYFDVQLLFDGVVVDEGRWTINYV